jgi:hypothetical protein
MKTAGTCPPLELACKRLLVDELRFTACGPRPRRSSSVSKEILVPFGELLQSRALDRGDMDEDVLAAVSGVMKPKPRSLLKNFSVPF